MLNNFWLTINDLQKALKAGQVVELGAVGRDNGKYFTTVRVDGECHSVKGAFRTIEKIKSY